MATATLISAAEYLAMPDKPGKHELLDGELISMPPARHSHSRMARALERNLLRTLASDRVWIFEGYQMRRGWLIPDVSVTWPHQQVSGWLQGPPMIAVEIVSPSNSAESIDKKVDAYLSEGGAEVWVVYPSSKSMVVFRADSTERITNVYDCKSLGISMDIADVSAASLD